MDRRFRRAASFVASLLLLCTLASVTPAQEPDAGKYPWTADAATVVGEYLAITDHKAAHEEDRTGSSEPTARVRGYPADHAEVSIAIVGEVAPASACSFDPYDPGPATSLPDDRWFRRNPLLDVLPTRPLRDVQLDLRATRRLPQPPVERFAGVRVVQLPPGELGRIEYSAPSVRNLRGQEIAMRDPVLKGSRAESIKLSRVLTSEGKLYTYRHEAFHYRWLESKPRVFTEAQFELPAYLDTLHSLSTGWARRIPDSALYAARFKFPGGSTRDITFGDQRRDVARSVLNLGPVAYQQATGRTLRLDTTGLRPGDKIGKQLTELRTWRSVRPQDFTGIDPHSFLADARNPREWVQGMGVLNDLGYRIDKSPLRHGTYSFISPAQPLSRIDPHSYLLRAADSTDWVRASAHSWVV